MQQLRILRSTKASLVMRVAVALSDFRNGSCEPGGILKGSVLCCQQARERRKMKKIVSLVEGS
jgi:hypothetical protein